MVAIMYKVISNKAQYRAYTKKLEELVFSGDKSKPTKDAIDLLTLLIETWDQQHTTFKHLDPVALLVSLMADHQMKASELAEVLGISKGYVSDILHYKKGLSKTNIQKLALHFKVAQEAFNRPYTLKGIKKQ